MGIGPIPVSKIERYAELLGLSPDEADRFETVIRLLDEAFVSNAAPKKEDGPKIRDEVSIDDRRGVLAILKRLAKKPKPSPVLAPSGGSL